MNENYQRKLHNFVILLAGRLCCIHFCTNDRAHTEKNNPLNGNKYFTQAFEAAPTDNARKQDETQTEIE